MTEQRPTVLALVTTPQGVKVVEPTVRLYTAALGRYPKVTCLATGFVLCLALLGRDQD